MRISVRRLLTNLRHRNRFRDVEEFDRLSRRSRPEKLKLIPELRSNHFVRSSTRGSSKAGQSREKPETDWYLWRRTAAPGRPARTNWVRRLRGSSWQWMIPTTTSTFNAFFNTADLNWRNPELRKSMNRVLRFWPSIACGTVRIDVLWHITKIRRNCRDTGQTRTGALSKESGTD